MASNNNYSWNKTLKFSWGHIIAFTALIFVSYVVYMGEFYKNGGDFNAAAVKVGVIDVFLLITFIGAQIYKGTNEHFERSLLIERILICLCPVSFVLAMVPYNHFWTVFSQREQIETLFSTSIENSRQMFSDYELYSNDRIQRYEEALSRIISNKSEDSTVYIKAGFTGVNDKIIKDNYVEALKLQLLSSNIDSLKNSALLWIDDANRGASVWNAFLVGNVAKISQAIAGWDNKLSDASVYVFSNEEITGANVLPFDQSATSYDAADKGLNALHEIYVKSQGVSLNTIWTGLVVVLMLLFPYVLQRRNEKAKGYYSLLPSCIKDKTKASDRGKGGGESHRRHQDEDLTQPLPNTSENHDDGDIYDGAF